jgi:hypothetical protein
MIPALDKLSDFSDFERQKGFRFQPNVLFVHGRQIETILQLYDGWSDIQFIDIGSD